MEKQKDPHWKFLPKNEGGVDQQSSMGLYSNQNPLSGAYWATLWRHRKEVQSKGWRAEPLWSSSLEELTVKLVTIKKRLSGGNPIISYP